MLRNVLLAGVFICVAAPALAATCVEPYAPTIPNGATATKEQMLQAQNDVKVFIRDSDTYQECLLRDVSTQRAAAARDQKQLDQAIDDRAKADIDRNQREKERVGAEYNVAVRGYSAAHPTPPASQ